jgi:hypothetical protein
MNVLTTAIMRLGLLAALAALSALWLWFMIRRPAQWASILDWPDAWLVRRGIISQSFAEKCKHSNRGLGRKLLIGLVGVFLMECAGGFLCITFLMIRLAILRHR